MAKQKRTFWADFKQFFLRGLVILLPSVLTLWILVMAYRFVDSNVAEPINRGIRQVILNVAPRVVSERDQPSWFQVTPEVIRQARDERSRQSLRPLSDDLLRTQIRARNFSDYWEAHWYLRFIGLAVAIILIYLAGLLLGGFIGRRVYSRLERAFAKVPLFKSVYPHVKQIVDFVLGENKQRPAFSRVVLVEYPRKGIWSVGLMTGDAMKTAERAVGDECITVFIPSSPTPFTGYTITIPAREAIDIPITIDEALRFVVSGGVLIPSQEQITPTLPTGAARAAEAGDLASAHALGMMVGSPAAPAGGPKATTGGSAPEKDQGD